MKPKKRTSLLVDPTLMRKVKRVALELGQTQTYFIEAALTMRLDLCTKENISQVTTNDSEKATAPVDAVNPFSQNKSSAAYELLDSLLTKYGENHVCDVLRSLQNLVENDNGNGHPDDDRSDEETYTKDLHNRVEEFLRKNRDEGNAEDSPGIPARRRAAS